MTNEDKELALVCKLVAQLVPELIRAASHDPESRKMALRINSDLLSLSEKARFGITPAEPEESLGNGEILRVGDTHTWKLEADVYWHVKVKPTGEDDSSYVTSERSNSRDYALARLNQGEHRTNYRDRKKAEEDEN